MPYLTAFLEGLKAIGAVFGFVNKKTELNNTPEMQKADEEKKQAALNDQISKDVQNNNEEANANRISP